MLHNISRSLEDLLGQAYMEHIQETAEVLHGMNHNAAKCLATEKVDFYSPAFAESCDALALKTGRQVVKPFEDSLVGAPTESFRKATHVNAAPIGGLGCVRVGQDGKAYLTSATCPDHLCVNQGKIDQSGETITCLPNRLTVTVYSAGTNDVELVG